MMKFRTWAVVVGWNFVDFFSKIEQTIGITMGFYQSVEHGGEVGVLVRRNDGCVVVTAFVSRITER